VSHLDSVLTLLSAIGETFALLFLLRRKIWRTLPVFSAYILWTLVSDFAGLYFQFHPFSADYLAFFTVEMTVDSVLQFTVLVELGWSVLRPVRPSLPRGSLVVLTLLVAVAGVIIWPLAGLAAPQGMGSKGLIIFHLEETFAILRVVCFLVMASFSQLLSIGWRDRELQVATGFGFYSIVTLLVSMLHSHQLPGGPEGQYHRLDEAVSISYLCTLGYWVLSFAGKEYQRKEFSPQMQQLLVLISGGPRTSSITLTDLPSDRTKKKD
jgi:hypothetical protein